MSKIVYYPDATDVFDITSCGGITYFCIQRDNKNDEHYLEIKVKKKKSFYSNEQVKLDITNQRYTYYDSKINRLAEHFKSERKLSSIIFDRKGRGGEYRVISSHLLDDKRYQSCVGGYILTPLSICKRTDMTKQNMYELFSGQFEQCTQFKSYVNTKTVRFLVALGICASSVRNTETWRFVPDPGAFDHIFTDEELYKKYNLTDDEIKLIESVIKERK